MPPHDPLIGASEASPLMTPKPYFRPDICRYIYIYIYIYIYVWYVRLTANLHLLVQRWPPIRCTKAVALWTEVEGCPPRVALCYGATPRQMVVGDKCKARTSNP